MGEAMRVLGIDPGTQVAGYGVVQMVGNRLRAVAHGAVRAKAGASFPERLRQIFDGLTQVVRKHRPDCVAVEEIFYGKSVKSAIRTGEGRGVALL
ncbi:MAG: crossover junction endodeoxyribonuclease RuvC, partial [Planctomycetes bacterium]|nr:crossover junction endodeoxyribonuclease RuvC [Planctomycetota bacterium]